MTGIFDVIIGVLSGSMSLTAAFFWFLQQWVSLAG